jgi:hypothetical protein
VEVEKMNKEFYFIPARAGGKSLLKKAILEEAEKNGESFIVCSDSEQKRYNENRAREMTLLYKAKQKSKRLKRFKTAIITILSAAALFIAFFILNGIANAWRGYEAVGGEILVFVLPLIIVTIRDGIHDFINRMK